MKVVLLGQTPLPSSEVSFTTFPQLRTWSMYRWLQKNAPTLNLTVELQLLHDGNHREGLNVHHLEDMKRLYHSVLDADAIVTAGPFLPLIALLHIPDSIPLWLDYPSDPLADRQSKHTITPIPTSEYQFISEICRHAMHRADAMGVISNRQVFASLGQRLQLGCPAIPIKYTPIAYDFPHDGPKINPNRTGDVVVSGSNNSWLDLDRLSRLLQDQTVHCTGMSVRHLNDRPLPGTWTQHGWLEDSDLQTLLSQCSYGVWTDTKCAESLLGSRTRALFYIWSGLTPIGDTTTELGTDLANAKCMNTWDQKNPFTPIDIERAQQFCVDNYDPDTVYAPLRTWLTSPNLRHRPPSPSIHDENLRLRRELDGIYASKTWRWGSKIHAWIQQLSPTRRQ